MEEYTLKQLGARLDDLQKEMMSLTKAAFAINNLELVRQELKN